MMSVCATIRLDDDLAKSVKELAYKEDVSFGRILNRLLRAGLSAGKRTKAARERFVQRTFDVGEPTFNVDRSLARAAAL